MAVAFPPLAIDSLAAYLSRLGMRQLHVAETEKYAHVTYFFNGGVEEALPGEDRVLVPSRRDVATYDLAPEMSADPITEQVVAGIVAGRYDFILVNYANPDMVGHTGVWDAAVRAAEVIDGCLARLLEATQAAGGALIVTADHGNIEEMKDTAGAPQTKHTTAPVPFLLVGPGPATRHASRRDPGRRGPHHLRPAGPAPPAIHDRAEPDRGLTLLDSAAMNPLVVAQGILAVALIAAILLQQRGTGLGGAFGGEVTAYRSRRGIERTLFRLTILLAVLFVIFSLLNLL